MTPEEVEKEFNYEKIMIRWDAWRKYISEGGGASWPRDEFENLVSCYEEAHSRQEKRIERLREGIKNVIKKSRSFYLLIDSTVFIYSELQKLLEEKDE